MIHCEPKSSREDNRGPQVKQRFTEPGKMMVVPELSRDRQDQNALLSYPAPEGLASSKTPTVTQLIH